MNLKKVLALLMSVTLAISLTACSQSGSSSQPAPQNSEAASVPAENISLTYYCGLQAPDVYTSNDEMLCYQMAEEATGIDIEWILPPKGQETEQFNLLISSADKPDIVESSWRTFAGGPDTAVSTKVIQDITAAVSQYMPNFTAYLEKYPDLIQQITSDNGKYYCVPYIFTSSPEDSTEWQSILNREPLNETYVGIIMRKDWLEDLKLDAPETIEDFISVLKAFKEQKGAEYPFSTTLGFLKQSEIFASAYDITSDLSFIDKDGTALFTPVQESYKEYLTVLNRLYTEGLLDPDFAVQDNTTNQAKITSGQTGMWLGYYSSWCNAFYDQLHKEDPDSPFVPVGLANPVLKKGQQLIYKQADYSYRSNGAAISTSCENVEAALTFLDWAFSDEGDLAMNWGKEGDTFVWENGWPSLTDQVISDPDELGIANAIQKYTRKNGPLCMDYYNRLILGKFSGTEEGLKALATWRSDRNGTTPASFPLVTATDEEGIRLSALKSEINTYVSECYVKFIMGEMPLSDFEKYVETVQSMGLEEYTRLTQASLDRYYARIK